MEKNFGGIVFYEKISYLCSLKGISITEFTKQIGASQSNVTTWKAGAQPRSKTIKIAAEFFGVPVSYFSETTNQTIHDNHGIIGNTHAPVTINGSTEVTLGDIEKELLKICSKLDMKRKNALLARAFELLEEI